MRDARLAHAARGSHHGGEEGIDGVAGSAGCGPPAAAPSAHSIPKSLQAVACGRQPAHEATPCRPATIRDPVGPADRDAHRGHGERSRAVRRAAARHRRGQSETVFDPEIPVNIYDLGFIYGDHRRCRFRRGRAHDADRTKLPCRPVAARPGRAESEGAGRSHRRASGRRCSNHPGTATGCPTRRSCSSGCGDRIRPWAVGRGLSAGGGRPAAGATECSAGASCPGASSPRRTAASTRWNRLPHAVVRVLEVVRRKACNRAVDDPRRARPRARAYGSRERGRRLMPPASRPQPGVRQTFAAREGALGRSSTTRRSAFTCAVTPASIAR